MLYLNSAVVFNCVFVIFFWMLLIKEIIVVGCNCVLGIFLIFCFGKKLVVVVLIFFWINVCVCLWYSFVAVLIVLFVGIFVVGIIVVVFFCIFYLLVFLVIERLILIIFVFVFFGFFIGIVFLFGAVFCLVKERWLWFRIYVLIFVIFLIIWLVLAVGLLFCCFVWIEVIIMLVWLLVFNLVIVFFVFFFKGKKLSEVIWGLFYKGMCGIVKLIILIFKFGCLFWLKLSFFVVVFLIKWRLFFLL